MRTEDEVTTELEAVRTTMQRLSIALDTARARYDAALKANADLSALDADQLAAGVSLDAESALVAVGELERRHKAQQEQVSVLRQELYHVSTQPAVDAYLDALDELMPAFADLAERIDAALAIKAGVKAHDPRVFHVFRVLKELRTTVDAYEKWRAPRERVVSWHLYIDRGQIVHLPAPEFERRERERLEKLRPRRRSDGALSGWL